MFEGTIVGLPRSRTFWFSQLLTYGDNFCYHCYPIYDKTIPEGKRLFNSTCYPYEGISGKLVIIERPVPEAVDSFMKFALNTPKNFEKKLHRYAVNMSRELRQARGLHIKYNEINERLPEILDYLDVNLPDEWVDKCLKMNMQTPDNDMSFYIS
jgi:hypothetical protein